MVMSNKTDEGGEKSIRKSDSFSQAGSADLWCGIKSAEG
jgi:hypothetical protein